MKLEPKKFQDLDESWMIKGESFSSDDLEIKNRKIKEEDFLKKEYFRLHKVLD